MLGPQVRNNISYLAYRQDSLMAVVSVVHIIHILFLSYAICQEFERCQSNYPFRRSRDSEILAVSLSRAFLEPSLNLLDRRLLESLVLPQQLIHLDIILNAWTIFISLISDLHHIKTPDYNIYALIWRCATQRRVQRRLHF